MDPSVDQSANAGGYVRLVARHKRLILAVALAVTAACAVFASRLRLDSNLIALLPESADSVVALHQVLDELGGAGDFMVMIESDDIDDSVAYARELLPEVRALDWVNDASIGNDTSFFERDKLLYIDLADLETIRDRVERRMTYEKLHRQPLYIDLSDEPPPSVDVSDIEDKYRGTGNRRRYYQSDDGRILILVVHPKGVTGDLGFARSSHRQLEELVARHPPGNPAIRVSVGGTFKNRIDEYDTILSDVKSTGAIVAVGLLLLLWIYFRSWLSIPVIMVPLAMSLVWTFAVAYALFGVLNIITVFLVVVLMGLGIDFGIHMLARFQGERLGDRPLEATLSRVLRTAGRASATAAATTAACFFTLSLFEFRGFSEFGVIAGTGLVMSAIAFLVVMPAALAAVHQRGMMPPRPRARGAGAGGLLRHPRLTVLGFAAIAAAAAAIGRHAEFEYDLREIRSSAPATREFNRKMRRVFSDARDPAAIVVDGPEQARAVTAALAAVVKRLGPSSPIDRVVALHSALPEHQDKKLAVLAELRRSVDKMLTWADGDERRELAELAKLLDVTPVRSAADLPAWVRDRFIGRGDGSKQLVFVFQRESLMDLRNALAYSNVLAGLQVDGRRVRAASEPLVLADMFRVIRRDTPRALALSLAVLVLVVFFDLRVVGGTLLVLVPLAWGVVVMVGLMALIPVKLNLLNAAVLPSVLGLGIDGGVHIYHAARERGRGRLSSVVRHTGGAVAVCTGTSMLGFGSMLVADHPGLRSIGMLAILGLGACLIGAVVLLPNLLAIIESARRRWPWR